MTDIYKSPEADLKLDSPLVETTAAWPIGGWLILVALSVLISPVRIGYGIYSLYFPLFTDGTLSILMDASSEYYNMPLSILIITETLLNTVMLIGAIYMAYLFFMRRSLLPKFYIIFMLSSFTFISLDAYVASLILEESGTLDSETTTEIIRSLLAIVIWVPYFLLSVRVKQTFVFDRNGQRKS